MIMGSAKGYVDLEKLAPKSDHEVEVTDILPQKRGRKD
jgi:hypothetical protein